tara:strand:+ start:3113 stop:3841 length:729 start_codon:yes stop_codon:yes gene_type:complete
LTGLILRHFKSLACLLVLKSVSRGFANAVRHAVHSKDFCDALNGDIFSALQECTLRLPLRVVYNYDFLPSEFPRFTHSDTLIVHEFCIESRYKHAVVTDPKCVIEWLVELYAIRWDYATHAEQQATRDHLDKMEFECTRICVEWPGVGMFHSAMELWDRLGVEEEHRLNSGGRWKNSSIEERNLYKWFTSSWPSHLPLELAVRLIPIACIGGATYTFNAPIDKHMDCFQISLLHHLLAERLC